MFSDESEAPGSEGGAPALHHLPVERIVLNSRQHNCAQRSSVDRSYAVSVLRAEHSMEETRQQFKVSEFNISLHTLPRSSGLPAVFVFQIFGFLHTSNGLAPAATFRQVRLEPWYETTLLGRDDVREPLRGAVCTIANTYCIAFQVPPESRKPFPCVVVRLTRLARPMLSMTTVKEKERFTLIVHWRTQLAHIGAYTPS